MVEIVTAMQHVVADYQQLRAVYEAKRAAAKANPNPEFMLDDPGLVDSPVDKPVHKPVDKPKPDAGVNAAAKAKAADRMAKARAAKVAKAKVEPTDLSVVPPGAKGVIHEEPPVEKPLPDVNEIIKIRQRTINDLQEAYANGHQKEVFELLSRFGNGAKSFRELTAESFLPIREAIDAGALK
jgi:hypothetical protein